MYGRVSADEVKMGQLTAAGTIDGTTFDSCYCNINLGNLSHSFLILTVLCLQERTAFSSSFMLIQVFC